MQKFASLMAVLAFTCASLSSANTPRYFKEDGGVQATYISLVPDGSYSVTAREHTFVRVEETGRWSKTGLRLVFTPKKSGTSPPYNAEEVSYQGRTFLALEGDAGPGIAVPIAKIKQSLDQNPKELPLYVFFEISSTVYEQETKQTYPFHSRH
jgi:hypothetical protein